MLCPNHLAYTRDPERNKEERDAAMKAMYPRQYEKEQRIERLKEAGIVVAFMVALGLVAAVVVFLMGRPR